MVDRPTFDKGVVGSGRQQETNDAVVISRDEEREVVGGKVGEGGRGDDEAGCATELVCSRRRWLGFVGRSRRSLLRLGCAMGMGGGDWLWSRGWWWRR